MLSGMSSLAQSESLGETSKPTGYEVTQITGLPDAKPNIKGRLTLSDTELLFTNPEFKAQVPFTRITNVFIGSERIETGGTTGQVMRKVIPYGGGMALAAVMQRSADLLTIEYVDVEGRDHGVVFFVPKFSAQVLSSRISSQLSHTTPPLTHACVEASSSPLSVVVEPIESRGLEVPAEYRVLLYEEVVNELRDSMTAFTYTRASNFDAAASCSGIKLQITVTGFNKGNRALRASTGPIGLFVGKTSISFHVELTDADGHSALSEDMTNSKRMDTESLGVAKSVAKAVSKKIRKLPATKSAT